MNTVQSHRYKRMAIVDQLKIDLTLSNGGMQWWVDFGQQLSTHPGAHS